jgi:hypothetical protein
MIYLEGIRDGSQQDSEEVSYGFLLPVYARSATEMEHVTVVHEIGHVFGCDHSDGYIMDAGGCFNEMPFSGTSLAKIRGLDWIGIP